MTRLGWVEWLDRSMRYVTSYGRVACSSMSVKRYRCGACGNLTRFEVVMSRRTRETHHVGLDGIPVIGGAELLADSAEEVVCAWCGDAGQVAPMTSIDGDR